jgi:radical SAM/Cys-rich protein
LHVLNNEATGSEPRFLKALDQLAGRKTLRRARLELLQVNLGDYCNQACSHCHVDAGPRGEKNMSRETVEAVIAFLERTPGLDLDITGGAPELNPHFRFLVTSARPLVNGILVRSNLTVLFESGQEDLAEFYRDNELHVIASMPCYLEENVDRQRGNGVFDKSINALRRLNSVGYGSSLPLDLVYNPQETHLPPPQAKLEAEYREHLGSRYGVGFSHLITITNVPVNRFKQQLEARGRYEVYLDKLEEAFNPAVVGDLMCRTYLSVGYDGKLYDCDFNQMRGWAMAGPDGHPLTIGDIDADVLTGREILVGDHCFACTAGAGSSCKGEIAPVEAAATVSACAVPATDKKQLVQDYYGKRLASSKDLKTSACCSIEAPTPERRKILSLIEPEIKDRFYGCGSPIPDVLEGCTVLDLGCGTGRDVYIASYLVGERGMVIGVDMTDEQLAVARKYAGKQAQAFGFRKPNVSFRKGYIEDLKPLGIPDESVDVVISNCVINLSPDKRSVFSEIFRVLKPGGELYFSDVFAGRRMPKNLADDPILYGECLGGAMYIEDFRRLLRDLGCLDFRITSKRAIKLDNPEVEAKAGGVGFYSMTVRAFKLPLEDICEDYGQTALYRGTIAGHPHRFELDDHHTFITGKPMLVCGNTAAMLEDTRYGAHFAVIGDRSVHYGPFDCAPAAAKPDTESGGACC